MDKKLKQVIDIASIARKHVLELGRYPPTLACACGLVSWYIVRMANTNGLYPTFVYVDINIGSHCWIEYRKHVIDASAQQFDRYLPDVYVIPAQKKNMSKMKDIYCEYRKIKKMRELNKIKKFVSELRFGYHSTEFVTLSLMKVAS